MKRFYSAVLASMVALAAIGSPAQAALRAPQIPFTSVSLQNRLNAFGETINVLTQQQQGLVWGSTISTNATMTIQYELAGNPNGNEIGIAALNATGNAVVLPLKPVFPSAQMATGWFAVASFRPGNNLIVNLFDPNAALFSTTAYTGVNRSLFAYYIKNAAGTFSSHEGFNADSKVHALAYAGTGQNTGCWWLTWEDSLNPTAAADYDDALLFMESLNPTPVNHTTWGSVKARFR